MQHLTERAIDFNSAFTLCHGFRFVRLHRRAGLALPLQVPQLYGFCICIGSDVVLRLVDAPPANAAEVALAGGHYGVCFTGGALRDLACEKHGACRF